MRLRYGDVRDTIQTGDMLAFSGTGPLHLGVRAWTWVTYRRAGIRFLPLPRYSHTGMALWVNGRRLFIVEQELSGCRMIPLSKRIRQFRGSIDWFAIQGEVRREAMETYALDQVFEAYSWSELVRTFALNLPNCADAGVCSTLYRNCLMAGGIDCADYTPMPDELVDLPCFTLRGTLAL